MSPTRRQLVLGGAVLALARPATAAASDVDRLEQLLALEHRLESAYATALEREVIERPLGELLVVQEREHVRALEQALRGAGRREPRAVAPAPLPGTAAADPRAFARFALELERQTVAAYRDALTTFGNERLLQPLGSIMASDAQHEVALRQLLGADLLGA